ncbi:unnamed protein product [Durusdinium trenchii]|uniref:Tubulin--tyrosine ligase-like protein 9 n=1 Tax=Durusdinium trenchii TaxID=1381693 RepID=A0ABP0RGI8_9DINO
MAASGAGAVLPLSHAEAIRYIEKDLLCGIQGARSMRLLDDCEPTAELVEYLREVLVSRGKSTKDWRCIMNKRIGLSYRSCSFGLVWLDDKLEQVHRTATQLGIQRHLPLLAAAPASDAAAAKKLWAAARQQVALNSSFVVKPRHGSNSKYVAMWPCPAQANEEAILESIEAALCAEDPSWRRESWNQNAVTKGAVLQPLYALMADVLETGEKDLTKLQKPLELKVQVLFGEVVGACLNSHPMYLWVTRDGEVIQWDPKTIGLLKKGHGLWEDLPPQIFYLLVTSLSEHWPQIRQDSEAVAHGLDELRVDWLLGDPVWGPRIGELTYMGTMALDVFPVSWRLAKAFAAAHLSRREDRRLEPFG